MPCILREDALGALLALAGAGALLVLATPCVLPVPDVFWVLPALVEAAVWLATLPADVVDTGFGLLVFDTWFPPLFTTTAITATTTTAMSKPIIRFLVLIFSGDGPLIRALVESFFFDK
jgi:hypothetical protein